MAALMIQGCGSDVGKSTLVAGLCRLFANRGLKVLPFKPQNMSNNAAVTDDGGEIGRAQALQAIAARARASVDMNPVLLKPESDRTAQVIVQGKVAGRLGAGDYHQSKPDLMPKVLESFNRLRSSCDLVLVEGAGSPAEINLRNRDIANMGFARAAQVPVVLVGDIDRGHVIAALAGAKMVLDPDDAAMIRGFIINKFRGDPKLFDNGRSEIARLTGWADLGLVHWSTAMRDLPAEDAVVLQRPMPSATNRLRVVVPMLSRIANFDDVDPLSAEPQIDLSFLAPGQALPGDTDLVILPGTKATRADLAFLHAQGWDVDIAAHVRRGGRVLGLCGGYQMLGRWIEDAEGMEGPTGRDPGLGLLDVTTRLVADKTVRPVNGTLSGLWTRDGSRPAFDGYEIHLGLTTGPDCKRPLLHLENGSDDGAISADGRIAGTYVHGLFGKAPVRQALLSPYGLLSDGINQDARVDRALDQLAVELESALDISALAKLADITGM